MKRVTYIDSAKGLGILFVVTAHLLGVLVLNDPKPFMEPIWKYLCSVTIAFFFVASGVTMALIKESDKDFSVIFKKKCDSLLYPYVVFSIIYLVYKISAVYIFHNSDYSSKDIHECIIDIISFRGSSVLWFLSALFGGSLVTNFIIKKINKYMALCGCFVICILVMLLSDFFNNQLWNQNYLLLFTGNFLTMLARIFTTSFFLLLGIVLFQYLNKDKSNIVKFIEIIVGLIFIIANFILSQHTTVDFAKNYYKNPIVSIICMIIGSIGLMLLCKNILDNLIFRFLGEQSLSIMVSHIDLKVLSYALSIAYSLNTHVTHAKEYVLYGTIILLIIIFEAFWILLFKYPLHFLLKKPKNNA